MPVIVDGHNLIGKMASISLADPNDEEKLVALLARYLRKKRQKTIVVFDKGDGSETVPRQMGPRLQILFAAPGSSADAIIIEMIKKDPNPKGLTIVSSDNEIRRCARSRRARLMSSEDFAKQLEIDSERSGTRNSGADRLEDIELSEWLDYFSKGRK